MKSIFAIVIALVAAVSAQANIVSITSPLTGTVYTAGKPAIITWIDQQVPVIPKIVLAKGQATALQPVSTIAENIDANAGTYVWNVPQDITPGTDYAFELGNSPNISFTGAFTIKASDGSSPAAANTDTTAVPNTAVPSASASVPVCVLPFSASASAKAAVATQAAGSLVVESSGLKISANKAAVGATAIAGAAAAAAAALI